MNQEPRTLNSQIPQGEWEHYLAIRDRMLVLQGFPKDVQAYDDEYGRLRMEANEIEAMYPDSDLEYRFKESLIPKE
jgi:hypothetical protein